MNELVSIVITTYKRADRLESAINSALNQTYKNIEVIVIDDNEVGSSFHLETKKIVKKYKGVLYVKNAKNVGGALSRNNGIDHATGRLIAFLDDDDEFFPEKIEKQYKLFIEHSKDNVGLVYCYCDRKLPDGSICGKYANDYEGVPVYEQMQGCIAGTSLWLASREALIESGNFSDTPSKQDSIMLLKMLAKGYSVFRVPESLAYYFEHGGDGISGVKLTNIAGIRNYRTLCRKHYSILSTRSEVDTVEHGFSKQLITPLLVNHMYADARTEAFHMFTKKPFSKDSYIALIKCLLPRPYVRHLQHKEPK